MVRRVASSANRPSQTVADLLLTIIVLTDDFATIRRLTEHLCRQTRATSIELVIACPDPRKCEVPPEAAQQLGQVTVIECPLLPMGEARAAAVRAAHAPVVVLGETHAFPASDWAEHLLRAHANGWDAVAPGMTNGNPETARSWTGLIMDYGRWLSVRPPGPSPEPPTYNASWRRDQLLEAGDRLADMLEPGGPIDHELARRGARFHHEPRAVIAHLNVVTAGAWAAERYCGGRLFGARRSRGWSPVRRIAYFAASVLVPFIRFVRTRRDVARERSARRLPRGMGATVACASLLWAIGEAVGYVAGEGRAEAQMLEYELHKERYA